MNLIGGLEILVCFGILFVVGIVLTIVLISFFRKKNNAKPANKNMTAANIPRPTGRSIKRCPTCQSTYTDESLNYCLSDGAILERTDEVETVVFRSK